MHGESSHGTYSLPCTRMESPRMVSEPRNTHSPLLSYLIIHAPDMESPHMVPKPHAVLPGCTAKHFRLVVHAPVSLSLFYNSRCGYGESSYGT